jgi:hypothetical protein
MALAAAPTCAQFPGGVSPPGQPRYKPKPDATRAGVAAESQRWYESALQEYNAKRYGTAMSMLDRAIAADADHPSAWYLRGVILHTRKDRAGASPRTTAPWPSTRATRRPMATAPCCTRRWGARIWRPPIGRACAPYAETAA